MIQINAVAGDGGRHVRRPGMPAEHTPGIGLVIEDRCSGYDAGVAAEGQQAILIDHLVGLNQHRGWNNHSEGSCRLQV
jgi:hypothetical protein